MAQSRIWTSNGFVADDPWVLPTAETAPDAHANARLIRAFDDFIADAEAGREPGEGVLVGPADDDRRLEPWLDRIALIAVAFPAFNDGRAFSHATRLRTVLGYAGEIRAVGDVLIDQIPLMLRCGIDSFAVSNPVALKRLEKGRLTGIVLHYQPAVGDGSAPATYSWRRGVAKASASV